MSSTSNRGALFITNPSHPGSSEKLLATISSCANLASKGTLPRFLSVVSGSSLSCSQYTKKTNCFGKLKPFILKAFLIHGNITAIMGSFHDTCITSNTVLWHNDLEGPLLAHHNCRRALRDILTHRNAIALLTKVTKFATLIIFQFITLVLFKRFRNFHISDTS